MWNYPLFSSYRREQNLIAKNWFAKKVYPVQVKYPFILKSKDDWNQNIILGSVSANIEKIKAESEKNSEPFPLHKYLHHGLSSQAMLFNLLGDAVIKKDLNLFKSLYPFPDIHINKTSELSFEYSDRQIFNENQAQPTSFDFAIRNKKGKTYLLKQSMLKLNLGTALQ